MQIDLDLVLLGRAAPGIHLHDPGNSQQAPLQYPILNGAEIGQTEVRRPNQLIAVNFADQAAALDLRRDVIRQADVLLQVDRGLRESEIIVDSILECDAHEGETVE